MLMMSVREEKVIRGLVEAFMALLRRTEVKSGHKPARVVSLLNHQAYAKTRLQSFVPARVRSCHIGTRRAVRPTIVDAKWFARTRQRRTDLDENRLHDGGTKSPIAKRTGGPFGTVMLWARGLIRPLKRRRTASAATGRSARLPCGRPARAHRSGQRPTGHCDVDANGNKE